MVLFHGAPLLLEMLFSSACLFISLTDYGLDYDLDVLVTTKPTFQYVFFVNYWDNIA